MKTLKDFIIEQTNTEEVIDIPVLENEEMWSQRMIDENEAEQIEEQSAGGMHQSMDPPAVLIMKRKSIRQFPNGQRVALYYVEKINKYVTLPYNDLQWSALSMPEEVEVVSENVMKHLQHIVDNHSAKSLKFKDGKTLKVDVQTANAVLKVHKALNDENKKKVADMAHKSKEHFGKVVDFAYKHLK